jgi:hypothetical protein
MALKPAYVTAHVAGAGLFGGGLALSLNQQLNFFIASWACEKNADAIAWSTICAVALLLASATLSWLAVRRIGSLGSAAEFQDNLRSRRFLAQVSLMGAALFLFAVAIQAAAAALLPECVG